MNKISLILVMFALVVIYIIVNGIAKELTAKQYIFNTYMYILLSIILIGTCWTVMDDNFISINTFDGWILLGIAVLSFLSLFTVLFTSNNNQLLKHGAWVSFILCIGILSYVTYKRNQVNDNLQTVFISLIVLVGVLAWIATNEPLGTFNSWFGPMFTILCGLIIVQLIDYIFFFDYGGNFMTRFRIYSWIGLLLFSGFLLYDTQKLIQDAYYITAQCVSKNQKICADYPVASLSIFLDIINLFTTMSNVSN
jgi:FtsH-binding integral membrane protein